VSVGCGDESSRGEKIVMHGVSSIASISVYWDSSDAGRCACLCSFF
jgi:hypothetical protein